MPDTFPVDSFKEAAKPLRQPFSPEAIKFRVLKGQGNRARCAYYIDARLAIARLNLVIPHKWEHRFEPVQGGMLCHLTVDGLTRSDVGWSNNQTDDMGLKALYSDAFKRAAVHFGIGESLYATPPVYLQEGPGLKVVDSGRTDKYGKPIKNYYIRPEGEGYLRDAYKQWLKEHGAEAFGEALDHGDVIGEQVAA